MGEDKRGPLRQKMKAEWRARPSKSNTVTDDYSLAMACHLKGGPQQAMDAREPEVVDNMAGDMPLLFRTLQCQQLASRIQMMWKSRRQGHPLRGRRSPARPTPTFKLKSSIKTHCLRHHTFIMSYVFFVGETDVVRPVRLSGCQVRAQWQCNHQINQIARLARRNAGVPQGSARCSHPVGVTPPWCCLSNGLPLRRAHRLPSEYDARGAARTCAG